MAEVLEPIEAAPKPDAWKALPFRDWLADETVRLWLSSDLPRLLKTFTSWVDRRVETITLVSDTRTQRRISVDLTIPATPAGPYSPTSRILPLALVTKGNLLAFDIRDESNRPIPVLTQQQVRALTTAMLAPMLEGQLRLTNLEHPEEHRARILRDLDQKVLMNESESPADQVIRDLMRRCPWFQILTANALIRSLVHDLAAKFILFPVIEANIGDRRIIKYGYARRFEPKRAAQSGSRVAIWSGEARRWFGLAPLPLTVDGVVPWASASFHAEVSAPPGAVIAASELRRVQTSKADGQFAPTVSKKPSERTTQAIGFDDRDPRIAHLRYPPPALPEPLDVWPGGDAEIVLELWPEKNGVLLQVSRGAWLAAAVLGAGALIKVLELAGWEGLQLQFIPAVTPVVLVAVPAAIAFYFAVQDHPLLQRLLHGTLVRSGVAALLAFVGAASLTLTNYANHLLFWLWFGLALAALANALLISLGRHRAIERETSLKKPK